MATYKEAQQLEQEFLAEATEIKLRTGAIGMCPYAVAMLNVKNCSAFQRGYEQAIKDIASHNAKYITDEKAIKAIMLGVGGCDAEAFERYWKHELGVIDDNV
ncbi:MAG: hypothetical protein FWH42_01390 [Dehalococcoidia bacterium]|nr:hypothetical protein [Dehalococcoidia bacterium]